MMSESSRRIRIRNVSLAASAALLAATTACGAEVGSTSGDSPGGASSASTDGKTAVTAAMYPLQWLAERVGGPDSAVTGLTKPGVEPHDLELSPIQVGGLETTGLVVYIRGVQPAVDEAVEQHAADRAFDAATAVTPFPRSRRRNTTVRRDTTTRRPVTTPTSGSTRLASRRSPPSSARGWPPPTPRTRGATGTAPPPPPPTSSLWTGNWPRAWPPARRTRSSPATPRSAISPTATDCTRSVSAASIPTPSPLPPASPKWQKWPSRRK